MPTGSIRRNTGVGGRRKSASAALRFCRIKPVYLQTTSSAMGISIPGISALRARVFAAARRAFLACLSVSAPICASVSRYARSMALADQKEASSVVAKNGRYCGPVMP